MAMDQTGTGLPSPPEFWRGATKSDELYVFVLLHRHFRGFASTEKSGLVLPRRGAGARVEDPTRHCGPAVLSSSSADGDEQLVEVKEEGAVSPEASELRTRRGIGRR